MTIKERDQWECLLADWSGSYDFTLSDDEADEQPFKAVPHADETVLLQGADPHLLREMVRQDHAQRAAAAAAREPR